MTKLNFDVFIKWLDAYGTAWQTGDPEAAVAIFSEDAKYYETPFDEPMVGKKAIYNYWREGAGQSQRDVHFMYQALSVVGNRGVAQWQANFVRVPSSIFVELDGILIADFDEAGQCTVFREWWHRQETDSHLK